MSRALITFSLGPVQAFIESARSVRDLWTGSYLLSWLTYHALRPILRKNGNQPDWLIFPAIERHPLWTSDNECCSNSIRVSSDDLGRLLSPCLPNRFLAVVPLDEAEARRLSMACVDACRGEWNLICNETYDQIAAKITVSRRDQFSRTLWDAQTQSFFDIQTAVLPLQHYEDAVVQRWLGETDRQGFTSSDDWSQSWKLLQTLFTASRSVRHVPPYAPPMDTVTGGQVTAKCSILGSYEQMGPAGLKESADFWRDFTRNKDHQKEHQKDHQGVRIDGIGTRSSERFCAISLIKRYAFATAFKKRIRDRSTATTFDISKSVRYPDTHTVAAAKWLKQSDQVEHDFELTPSGESTWNGLWLQWERPNQDDAEFCPDKIWNKIQAKKRLKGKDAPPIYYAVLMLDGDKMGDRLRTASQIEQTEMSRLMSRFALDLAREIVEGHDGELIYSGGDDVLALLPVETALDCADELRQEFAKLWSPERHGEITVSAGLSLVHAKEDLRLALAYARTAEKLAKNSGRNCLTLKSCRGSGEYSTVVLPWEFIPIMNRWVSSFIKQASDRWAYRLAAEMTTWSVFSDVEILKAELNRQLNRSDEDTRREFLPKTGQPTMAEDLQAYHDSLQAWSNKKEAPRMPQVGKVFERFIDLVQSASFIARGRDH